MKRVEKDGIDNALVWLDAEEITDIKNMTCDFINKVMSKYEFGFQEAFGVIMMANGKCFGDIKYNRSFVNYLSESLINQYEKAFKEAEEREKERNG